MTDDILVAALGEKIYLSEAEVADELGITPSGVLVALMRGHLHARRLGADEYRIHKPQALAWWASLPDEEQENYRYMQ